VGIVVNFRHIERPQKEEKLKFGKKEDQSKQNGENPVNGKLRADRV